VTGIADWRKPRRSVNNGACFEARSGPGFIGVRDSKLADRSPVLAFSPAAWEAFVTRIKKGQQKGRLPL
jgi:Domain of unknown function (DUF397)